MADTKQTYSHSPVNLPDEPQHPDRKITVLDGNFERVIARIYHTDKDNALENAEMIVKALALAQIVGESLKCPRCGLGELERLRILEELGE